jgi:predicted protein tyrosine phosphatase
MNVLFVCTLNKARSIAAESMYRGVRGLSVRSAGISERAAHPLATGDLSWADLIIVFESLHESWIRAHLTGERPKIINIAVPDGYGARNPEMLALLRESLTPHLGAPRIKRSHR